MARSSVQPLAAERPEEDSKLLPPGTKAPNFTLHSDQTLTLSDLAGKPVVLASTPRSEGAAAEILDQRVTGNAWIDEVRSAPIARR